MKRRIVFAVKPLIVLSLLSSISSIHADIEARYSDSTKCKPCHKTITQEWQSSLHAKSHFSKNELYAKLLGYTAKKKHQPESWMEVRCAQCHNPRVLDAVNQKNIDMAGFGFDEGIIRKKMGSSFIKDGVNCIVCHNIQTVHDSVNAGKRGKDTVVWGANDTMVGPFPDARSPYHKTAYSSIFKEESNRLCFVCHYNERSAYGVEIGSTGKEYESSGDKTRCVECHMGPSVKKRAVQVDLQRSTSRKVRTLRRHLFAGVRNSDIVSEAIDIDYRRVGRKITVRLKNLIPHKLPTGFGGRLLRIYLVYRDQSGTKIGEDMYDIGAKYADKKGKETIPHLAARILSDNRLKPFSSRDIVFRAPENSKSAEIFLQYYLMAPEWLEKLEVTDPLFRKKYDIASMRVKF
ncbi:multiheme c-type cytochrome [Hydrogenimonas urashimensis]|uniref:multiheme c-type cytochrome n=1 Tax=Hydrogenimonas urashimensis TaxID=2740515 RepID=UPI001915BCED|nr:multiheme c-type cytochrome [Hydrogenimonas urashimensis]